MMRRKINPREAKRMMQRMGMSMDAVSDVEQVTIKTSDKEITIEAPEVSILEVQGQKIFQVMGERITEKAVEKKAVDRFIGILNRVRDAYSKDGIQKMIRARARPLLEKSTRDLFERFNLAYSDIKIDDDFFVAGIRDGTKQFIENFLLRLTDRLYGGYITIRKDDRLCL
jgi:hypothetical protein